MLFLCVLSFEKLIKFNDFFQKTLLLMKDANMRNVLFVQVQFNPLTADLSSATENKQTNTFWHTVTLKWADLKQRIS